MTVQSWNSLREAAQQGFFDGVVCLATIEIVERSNRGQVIEPLTAASAGLAARVLVDSALARMHLFVCRAYAPVSKKYDDDTHLRAAIEYLAPEKIAEQQWPSEREALREAVALFKMASNDARLLSLTHMRNKLIAHLGHYDETIPRPRYNDLFGFTRETARIWECLAQGAGIVALDLESQVISYRESAEAFWSVWECDQRE